MATDSQIENTPKWYNPHKTPLLVEHQSGLHGCSTSVRVGRSVWACMPLVCLGMHALGLFGHLNRVFVNMTVRIYWHSATAWSNRTPQCATAWACGTPLCATAWACGTPLCTSCGAVLCFRFGKCRGLRRCLGRRGLGRGLFPEAPPPPPPAPRPCRPLPLT